MKSNSMFGIAARVGGIATGLVAISCDVEPQALEPRAQVGPLDLEVEGATPPSRAVVPPSYPCDRAAHPSVHVVPVLEYDDYFLPADVDVVWFEHEDQTFEARCIHGENGECIAWMAGYELAGPITVSTEYCETVVSATVDVGMEPDGCHVRTEYLLLEVSTRGCLTTEPPAPPSPPRWPWDLVGASSSEHPGHGDPEPVGRPTDLAAWHHVPPPPATDDVASPG